MTLVFEAINYLREEGYEIPDSAVQKALKTVCWPCRMQYIKNTIC